MLQQLHIQSLSKSIAGLDCETLMILHLLLADECFHL